VKPHEARRLTYHDLQNTLLATRKELFNLRLQMATGQLENHRQIRRIRRDIALLLTVMAELRRAGVEHWAAEAAAEIGVVDAPSAAEALAAEEAPAAAPQDAILAEEVLAEAQEPAGESEGDAAPSGEEAQ
jgi:large subunit ribosomal protein L29